MSEDNKIATGQLQPSDDIMDMDLIKRADTSYMPGMCVCVCLCVCVCMCVCVCVCVFV